MIKDIQIGDKVEIVKYGSLMWENTDVQTYFSACKSFKEYSRNGSIIWFDTNPELIGKHGVVVGISPTGGYKLDGIPKKTAWYDEKQLKIIQKGVNHVGPHK